MVSVGVSELVDVMRLASEVPWELQLVSLLKSLWVPPSMLLSMPVRVGPPGRRSGVQSVLQLDLPREPRPTSLLDSPRALSLMLLTMPVRARSSERSSARPTGM